MKIPYCDLFPICLMLAGFVLAVLVYQYNRSESFTQKRKDIILYLIRRRLRKHPTLAVMTQRLGKEYYAHAQEQILSDLYDYNHEAVHQLITEIQNLVGHRNRLKIWGFVLTGYLLTISVYCAVLCWFQVAHIAFGIIAMVLLLLAIALVPIFIWYALRENPER